MNMRIKQQSGVTLLISILIMSGIVLISLAVAAFTIREIRNSRAVALTEPALGAAESGGEQALWELKRGNNPSALPDCPTQSGSNLTTNNIRTEYCLTYGAALLDLEPGVEKQILLYDANDQNGNICMNVNYTVGQHSGCSGAAIFSSISFQRISGTGAIDIAVTDLVGNPAVSPASQSTFSLNNDNIRTVDIDDPISDSNDERLRIRLLSTAPARVRVTSSPVGLPDYPIIRSSGCSSKGAVGAGCTGNEVFNRNLELGVDSSPAFLGYNLTVTKGGSGTGRVYSTGDAGDAIDCGSVCQAAIEPGIDVVLHHSADAGSTFSTWGGDCAFAGAAATCTITIDSVKNVSATFTLPPATITWTGFAGAPSGSQNMSVNPHLGITTPGTYNITVNRNMTVGFGGAAGGGGGLRYESGAHDGSGGAIDFRGGSHGGGGGASTGSSLLNTQLLVGQTYRLIVGAGGNGSIAWNNPGPNGDGGHGGDTTFGILGAGTYISALEGGRGTGTVGGLGGGLWTRGGEVLAGTGIRGGHGGRGGWTYEAGIAGESIPTGTGGGGGSGGSCDWGIPGSGGAGAAGGAGVGSPGTGGSAGDVDCYAATGGQAGGGWSTAGLTDFYGGGGGGGTSSGTGAGYGGDGGDGVGYFRFISAP